MDTPASPTTFIGDVYSAFEQRVRAHPSAVAIDRYPDDQTLTYQQLAQSATKLSSVLLKTFQVQKNEIIAIFTGSQPLLVSCMLAVLRSGATFLPLDPDLPSNSLGNVLTEAGVRLVLTTRNLSIEISQIQEQANSQLKCRFLFVEELEEAPFQDTDVVPASEPSELAYVIFTSGSTGAPKGVMIRHEGLLNLTRANGDAFGLRLDFRVLQFAYTSFDACVWEIFSAILNGAVIVFPPPRDEIPVGKPLATFLRAAKISLICVPPSVLTLISDDAPALPDLEVVVTAGEKCPLNVPELWVQNGKKFFNAYGPTEVTVCASMYQYTGPLPYPCQTIPIGTALPNTQLLVLTDQLTPVTPGEIGFLYVTGVGVATGYYKQPGLEAHRFIDGTPLGFRSRLYNTGDLVLQLPDGNLEFKGRADNQVKIRGFRIELEAVEAAIYKSTYVRTAVVVVRDVDVTGQEQLVAFVSCKSALPEDQLETDLKRTLASELPYYMIPHQFVFMNMFPMMSNGSKIDRKKLQQMDIHAWKTHLSKRGNAPDETEKIVIKEFAGILGLREHQVEVDTSFFEMGGTSILGALLTTKLSIALRKEIAIRTLYACPTPRLLGKFASGELTKNECWNEVVDVDKECVLDPEIVPLPKLGNEITDAVVLKENPQSSLTIFMTGVTGLYGAHILYYLLSHSDLPTERIKVICLVRASSQDHGMQKLVDTLKDKKIWDEKFRQNIVVALGDLALPRLGLSPALFNQIAHEADMIFHVGADISYVKPYSQLRGSNVEAVQEILRMTVTGKYKPLHYASTLGVYGSPYHFGDKDYVDEDDPVVPFSYLNGDPSPYTISKYVAERMVHEAVRRGVPVRIYRPGFIQPNYETCCGNLSDMLCRLFLGCVQLGCYPDVQKKYFNPVIVDFAAKAWVHIALWGVRKSNKLVFNIIPDRKKELTTPGMFEVIAQMGYPLKAVPMKVWLQEVRNLMSHPDGHQNVLYYLSQFMTEKFLDNRFTVLEVHHHTPDAGIRNVIEALEGSGIEVPGFEAHHLQRFIRHWININHWPAPPAQAPLSKTPVVQLRAEASAFSALSPKRNTSISRPRSESPATVFLE